MFNYVESFSEYLKSFDSPYVQHLGYIILHKYIVYVIGRELDLSRFQLLIHDWTKFLPVEWFAYTRKLYGTGGHYKKWQKALLHHYNHNPHHWRYWLRPSTSDCIVKVEMPTKYKKEMVADWASAGYCINEEWDLDKWFQDNKDQMTLTNEIYIEHALIPKVEKIIEQKFV
jgi:hypothetical protein